MIKKFGSALLVAMVVSGCASQETPPPEIMPDIRGVTIDSDSDPMRINLHIEGDLAYILTEIMEQADRGKIINAYTYNPDQHTSKWINQRTDNQFTVTMQLSYIDNTTSFECRDGEIIAITSETQYKAYSTACRKNDRWYFR
jgi:hypothetical protein